MTIAVLSLPSHTSNLSHDYNTEEYNDNEAFEISSYRTAMMSYVDVNSTNNGCIGTNKYAGVPASQDDDNMSITSVPSLSDDINNVIGERKNNEDDEDSNNIISQHSCIPNINATTSSPSPIVHVVEDTEEDCVEEDLLYEDDVHIETASTAASTASFPLNSDVVVSTSSTQDSIDMIDEIELPVHPSDEIQESLPQQPIELNQQQQCQPRSRQTCNNNRYGGLINLGNTCYMNSALQVLASLDEFVDKIRCSELRCNKDDEGNDITNNLRNGFIDLMDTLARGETVRPIEFKQRMDDRSSLFVGYHQQDAHEFLTTLLDLLDEDYKKEEAKEENKEQKEDIREEKLHQIEKGDEQEIADVGQQDNQDSEVYESNKKARRMEQLSVQELSSQDSTDTEASVEEPVCVQSFSDFNVEEIEQLIHGSCSKKIVHRVPSLDQSTPEPKYKLVGGRMNMMDTIVGPISGSRIMGDVNMEGSSSSPSKVGESEVDDVSVFEMCESASPVENYFKTEVCVSLTCDSCKYTRKHNETYLHLSLEIGTGADNTCTVEDGLRKFFAPEKRELKCEKCFCETAMQKTEITKLPRVLLLHFKRFIVDVSPDYTSITYRKNQSSVSLEQNLTLSDDYGVLTEFVAPDVIVPQRKSTAESQRNINEGRSYSLKSTVNHIGSSAGCGHYTADAKRYSTLEDGTIVRQWVRFNDSYVHNISEKEATVDSSRTVYMALYELS